MIKDILDTLMPYLKKADEFPDGFSGRKKAIKLPEFSLEDLLGKKLEMVATIKNPLPYDPEKESPNPAYFSLEFFDDNSYLLHMEVGWHDGSTLHSFLVEEGNVRYSNQLYNKR